MRSHVLTFEASGIDHVGLIQICFSAEATVSRICEKSLPGSVVPLLVPGQTNVLQPVQPTR